MISNEPLMGNTFSYEWFHTKITLILILFNTKETLIDLFGIFSKSQPTTEILLNMSVPIPFPVKRKTESHLRKTVAPNAEHKLSVLEGGHDLRNWGQTKGRLNLKQCQRPLPSYNTVFR